MLKNWQTGIAIILSLASVAGLVFGFTTYFASASELRLTQLRLDQKIVTDQVMDVQKRMWALEEKNKEFPDVRVWPASKERQEYKELECQLEELKVRRDSLMKK